MACTAGELQHLMEQFRGGSEKRFRHWANRSFILTEGLMESANIAGAHWLMDILATEVVPLYAKAWLDGTAGVAEIKLTVRGPKSSSGKAPDAKIEVFFDTEAAVFSKHIDLTDFPEGEWVFLLGTDQGPGETYLTTGMIPQEY